MEYLTKYWKTIAAIVYLSICIFDFIAAPVALIIFRSGVIESVVELQKAGVNERVLAEMATIGKAQEWIPFTLRSGGLFHLSFGAILGTAVWRGKKDE